MAKVAKRSTVVTVAIVLLLGVWAVAVGAYLARTGGHGAAALPPPKENMAGAKERWVGIYQGGTKIGYGYSGLRTLADGYYLVTDTKIQLQILNQVQKIDLSLRARLGPDYAIRRLSFEMQSNLMNLKAEGRVEGNELILALTTAGATVEQRLPFDQPPTLGREFVMAERLAAAKPGESFSFSEFDPTTQRSIPIVAAVVGEEALPVGATAIPCVKVEVTYAGQSEFTWISKDGEIQKTISPATGFEYRLETQAEATTVDWERAGTVDLAAALMVKSNTALPNPRGLKKLRARLLDAPLDHLDLQAPGRQRAEGNRIEIAVETPPAPPGYALPIAASLPEKSEELAAFLAPTAFIQSADPKILAAAEEAADGAGDAVTAAERLAAWVADQVADSMVVTIPSALDTLANKRGACKEHTVLFVALARALGLPARPVSGIVYSEQVAEGFYYHAWAEVWLGGPDGSGGWVAVDPTFKQFPADATHIKLKEGELGDMIQLMQVIGKLRVEVEDYQ
jgi:transglutaminase-like putative cysteine protease